jgi:tetratricopeptide (TPR) repeat protein
VDGPQTPDVKRLMDEAKKAPTNLDKQRAVYEAAKLQADSGDIDAALLTAGAVSHPELHATIITHICARLVNLGEKERSADVFGDALAAADRVENANRCSFAINLGMTAHMLAQRGLHERILGSIHLSVHEDLKANLMYWIAAGLSVEGHYDKALEIANSIEDPLTRGRSLENIAEMLKNVGQKERAAQLFKEARRLIQEHTKGDD